MKHRTVFTFVREPLGRFISGYAEIDRIYLGPRYELLWTMVRMVSSGTYIWDI
jgi:hypothetical protein